MNIKEILESAEGKAAVQAIVDEAVAGLKAKNTELLGDMKKIKDAKTEAEKRLEELAAEKNSRLEDDLKKSGEFDKLKEQIEARHKKEVDGLNETVAKLKGQLDTHVIGEGLTAALVKAKVAPQLMDAAKALIKAQFKGEIGENDGTPFAKFDGKAVDDFVTGWSQSDAGKHFVQADSNTGGGSNGANANAKGGNAGQKTMSKTEFDKLDASGKKKVSLEGVKLIDN